MPAIGPPSSSSRSCCSARSERLVVARPCSWRAARPRRRARELPHEPRAARARRPPARRRRGDRGARRGRTRSSAKPRRASSSRRSARSTSSGRCRAAGGAARERETRRLDALRRESQVAGARSEPRSPAPRRPRRVQRQGVSMSCVSATAKRAPPGQAGVGATPASRIAAATSADERVDRRVAPARGTSADAGSGRARRSLRRPPPRRVRGGANAASRSIARRARARGRASART